MKVFNATVNGAKLEIIYVDDDATIDHVLSDISNERVVGYDVETYPKPEFKLDRLGGLDPYRSELRLIQFGKEDGTVYLIDNLHISDISRAKICKFLEQPFPVKVGHNIKFDVKFSRAKLGVTRFGGLFCTELATRLVKCGTTYGRVRLVDSVEEFVGVKVQKEQQLSDWSKPVLDEDQIVYAAYDAYVVLLLRRELLKYIGGLELIEVTKLEFDALDPVASMELNGLGFNEEGWLSATEKSKEKRLKTSEAIADILSEVVPQQTLFTHAPTGVKLSSHKQMVQVLNAFGIDLPAMSEPRGKGKSKKKIKKAPVEQGDLFSGGLSAFAAEESENTYEARWKAAQAEDVSHEKEGSIKQTTRNWQIKPLKERYKVIGLLLDWREYEKRVTSYGIKYLRFVNPVTGRIHSDYDPLRAKTGRWANSKPNLQQIPRDSDYRHCFIPTEGWKFVGADYSQIELRIAAEIFLEWKMIEAFKAGIDPHDNTTHQMFHLEFPPEFETQEEEEAWNETEDGKQWGTFRVFAKNINFGIPYGMGKFTLATRTGLTVDEADEHLNTYCDTYRDLVKGLEGAARTVRETGQIRTLSGRIAKFQFNPNDKEDVARAERNGKNTPIQGGNADIMKLAVRYLFDRIHDEGLYDHIRLVHIVHDEIICEARIGYETKAAEILETSMKTAAEFYLKIVPVEVKAKITAEWKK